MPMAMPAMMGVDILGNAIQGNQAKQAQKGQYANMNKIFAALNPEVRGLYDKALGLMTGAGTTAKREAEQTSNAAMGAGDDSAIGRGLYNSSYLDTMHRGILSDLNQTKAGIDEQTAAQMAGILQGKAGAITQLGLGHAGSINQYQFGQGQGPGMANWAKVFWPNGVGGGGGSSGFSIMG